MKRRWLQAERGEDDVVVVPLEDSDKSEDSGIYVETAPEEYPAMMGMTMVGAIWFLEERGYVVDLREDTEEN